MRSIFKKYLTLIVVTLCCASPGYAQDVALKTNLLGWAAGGTVNGGLEFGLGRKTTMQLYGALNPWTYNDGKRARFWYASPELRLWFCQKFSGSFIGIHALGGQYNIRNIDLPFHTLPDLPDGYHYDGWYVGGGLTYGYQWVMSKHWNFEASLGVGYAYTRYRKCQNCKPKETRPRNYVGPTKAALSLIYCF